MRRYCKDILSAFVSCGQGWGQIFGPDSLVEWGQNQPQWRIGRFLLLLQILVTVGDQNRGSGEVVCWGPGCSKLLLYSMSDLVSSSPGWHIRDPYLILANICYSQHIGKIFRNYYIMFYNLKLKLKKCNNSTHSLTQAKDMLMFVRNRVYVCPAGIG